MREKCTSDQKEMEARKGTWVVRLPSKPQSPSTTTLLALGMLMQEHHKFEASLATVEDLDLKNHNNPTANL